MAVTFVGTGGTNGGKPGYTDTLPSAYLLDGFTQPQVGDIILVWCVFDNLSSTTPAISTIAKAPSETNSWTKLASYDSNVSTSAGAGTRGELWGILVSVGSGWSSTLSITTTGGTITAAMTQCFVFRGASLNVRGFQVNSVSAAVIGEPGDLVMGMAGSEGNSALTADTDTTGGVAWSSAYTGFTTGGGSASNVTSIFQYKIPTSSATQNYSAGTLTDGYGIAIALQPAGGNAGSGSGAATWTGSAVGSSTNVAYGNHAWTTSATGDAPSPTVLDDLLSQSGMRLFLGEDHSFDATLTNSGTTINVGDTVLAYFSFNNLDAASPNISTITVPAGETATWRQIWSFSSPVSSPRSGVRGEVWGITVQSTWSGVKAVRVELSGSGATVATLITYRVRDIDYTPLASAFDAGVTPWSASITAPAQSLVLGMYSHHDNAVGAADADGAGGASWTTRRFTQAEWPSYPVIERLGAGIQYKIPTSTTTQTYDSSNTYTAIEGINGILALGPPVAPAPQTASGTMRWTARATGDNGRLYVRYKAGTPTGDVTTGSFGLRMCPPDATENTDYLLVGDTIVFLVTMNTSASTSSPSITSITKHTGETNNWEKLTEWNDGATPGTRSELWAITTTVPWPKTSNCTISFNTATLQKTSTQWTIRGNKGLGVRLRDVQVDSGTSPWAATSTAAVWGDVILGIGSVRSNTATSNYTADTDSTNVYWSQSTRGVLDTGTSSTSLFLLTQYKMVEGGGSQTWDFSSTDTTSHGDAAIVVLAPKDMPTGNATLSGTGTLTLAGSPGHTGTAALSGAGTLSPVADLVTVAGSTALSGVGVLLLAAAAELLPPANLTVTVVSPTQLDISWDAATGATGYDLERDGVIISEYQPTTSYSDTGLTEGTTYTYRVRSQKVE